MKIEVVEFYTKAREDNAKKLFGSLHVYIEDLAIDIRGVRVSKIKNKWKFLLPTLPFFCEETGEKKAFPVVEFSNLEQKKEVLKMIRSKGRKYIFKNILSKEYAPPVVSQQLKKQTNFVNKNKKRSFSNNNFMDLATLKELTGR